MKLLIVVLCLAACGSSPPPATRYYQLALPAGTQAQAAEQLGALVIEPLTAEGAYDDERMVYRSSPYRLDYYDYHRWGAAPGPLVTTYLQQVLRKSGRFKSVVTDDSSDEHALTLSGRILAIEEVDTSKKKWNGHIALELSARDASGKVVWTQHFDETAPMPVQSPEGLAAAVTAAMQRIAGQIAPQLGEIAERQVHARQRTVWRDSTSSKR